MNRLSLKQKARLIKIIQADDQALMPIDVISAAHLSLLFDCNADAEADGGVGGGADGAAGGGANNEPENEPENAQWLPSNAQIEQWALAALSHSLTKTQQGKMIEISVTCVSSDEIRKLNAQYRSKNSVTNVLSFPADMPLLPADETRASPTLLLGDVVVCPPVLKSEALQQNKLLEHHWAHMVIHSILHLTGFDHEDAKAADTMESLEIQILSGFGIANPYVAA